MYNFCIDFMVGKTHLHPFFQQKIRFLIKKIHYFPIYRKVLLILGSNFPVMFIRWLSTTFLLTPCLWKSRFLDLTAVNMQKNVFLAIFWIYILTNSIPLPLSNSLRQLSNSFRQLSNLLTLQLTTSPTHLLTYSPTLSTNGGSTSSSLVSFCSLYVQLKIQEFPVWLKINLVIDLFYKSEEHYYYY